jgi:ribulose 1,5-bisphosphate synthetase/thiazole synthase
MRAGGHAGVLLAYALNRQKEVTTPMTDAKKKVPDMSRAWAGRDKATAKRQADRAIATLTGQGLTVILIDGDERTQTFHP